MRQFVYLALILGVLGPRLAWSQTPSPLQEWQYSEGIILQQLFERHCLHDHIAATKVVRTGA